MCRRGNLAGKHARQIMTIMEYRIVVKYRKGALLSNVHGPQNVLFLVAKNEVTLFLKVDIFGGHV